ncbi:hypothetical protein [Streptomyces crystallinus]|uniref:hypothetical protein n=1 Tax=Streptomyces crystallinus TaxID=68191 RepID=UPI0031CFD211
MKENNLTDGVAALINIAGTFITLLKNKEVGAQLPLDAVQALRPMTTDYPSYRRQLAEWEVSPGAAFLAGAGRWEEATAVGEEAIGLYRKLAAENPGDDELTYRISWAQIAVAIDLAAKTELQPKATDLTLAATDNLRTLATNCHRPPAGGRGPLHATGRGGPRQLRAEARRSQEAAGGTADLTAVRHDIHGPQPPPSGRADHRRWGRGRGGGSR